MYHLDFQNYTITHKVIVLPENGIWYRASSPYLRGIDHGHALFMSMRFVADFYMKNDPLRTLECYKNTRELRLLDIRYFQEHVHTILTNRSVPLNKSTLEWLKVLCATFGGCSLQKQYELLQYFCDGKCFEFLTRLRNYMNLLQNMDPRNYDRNVSPIEPMAFRVGITDLDYEVIHVVRDIFQSIDGFISPFLFSPAHNQMGENQLLPEIIFFYPNKSLVSCEIPKDGIDIEVHSLQSLLQYDSREVFNPVKFEENVFVSKEFIGGNADTALVKHRSNFEKRLGTSKRLQKNLLNRPRVDLHLNWHPWAKPRHLFMKERF